MRTIVAILCTFVLAAVGVLLVMPAISNGDVLSGFEFFGLLAVCTICVTAYAFIVQARTKGILTVWSAAFLVGVGTPFVVLTAPLVFCIAFE